MKKFLKKLKTSLDLAVHYFELLLSTKHYGSISPYSHRDFEDYCDIKNVDKNCSNWFKDYDLILLPSLDSK